METSGNCSKVHDMYTPRLKVSWYKMSYTFRKSSFNDLVQNDFHCWNGYEGWQKRLKRERDVKKCQHMCSSTSGDNTPYYKISIFGIICFVTGILLSSVWRQRSTLWLEEVLHKHPLRWIISLSDLTPSRDCPLQKSTKHRLHQSQKGGQWPWTRTTSFE